MIVELIFYLFLIYQINHMNMTTISISKIITRIQSVGNGFVSVTEHRFNELESLVSGLESFEFSGLCKSTKFEKLHLQLMNAGFMVANVIMNEPVFETGVQFRVVYSRCK